MEPLQSTSKTKTDVEEELTNKFLSGEMTFDEYSNEWYSGDEEDFDSDRVGVDLKEKEIVRRRKNTRLSPALLGLMGEANLRFVRGESDVAEKMCHEIIKQVPNTPEPYQTLAQIYENDAEKSLQFSLLAAHLGRSDTTEWLRLAAICKERKDFKQEMICYTQGIRSEPHNINMHLKRIDLLSNLEEIKYPTHNLNISKVRCYRKIVNSMPPSEGEIIMEYTKMAVTLYHNNNEIDRALEVMSVAYSKCPQLFTLEDINIYLELNIARKQYEKCLDIFIAKFSVEIEAEIQTIVSNSGDIEEQTNYLNCTLPDDLPIDLKSKLLVCFIHLGAIDLVQSLLNDFLNNDVEKAGDLYMDIEEAFSAVGRHELALQLLEPLIKNTNFDLGAVWLKYAECLFKLGRHNEAINSYYKVLQHAPQHADAREKLSDILKNNGSIEKALEVMNQSRSQVVSASLLYKQCCLLKENNKILDYLKVGEDLLSKNFIKYRHREELHIASKVRSGVDLIQNFRISRGENPHNDDDIQFDEKDAFKLTPEQEWDMFTELLEIALNHKKYATMQRLSFGALMSRALVRNHIKDIEFYCLQSCLLNHDYTYALRIVRDMVQRNPTPRSWNILSLVLNSVEESSHVKYLTRLFAKESNIVKYLLLGSNFLTSGRYLDALKYFLEYHEQCREPLSALLVGITILVMAAQRTMDKHHNLILQGIAFLTTYRKLRKCDQETNYNLGRAYQMLGINNLAIEHYERALACKHITECEKHGKIDLSKETAYNLYILYKDHSPHLARKYMLDYLVI